MYIYHSQKPLFVNKLLMTSRYMKILEIYLFAHRNMYIRYIFESGKKEVDLQLLNVTFDPNKAIATAAVRVAW